MVLEIDSLIEALSLVVPCESESEMCERIDALLESKGFSFIREHRLSRRDRVDYLLKDLAVGIEVKSRGSRMQVNRQCLRYLESSDLDALILLTRKPMALPLTVFLAPNGTEKRIHVIELWKNAL